MEIVCGAVSGSMASFGTTARHGDAEEEDPIARAVNILASSKSEQQAPPSTFSNAKTQACYYLISLVTDYRTHAIDLLRKGNGNQGILPLASEMLALRNDNNDIQPNEEEQITAFVQLLASACDYKEFTQMAIQIDRANTTYHDSNDGNNNHEADAGLYNKDSRKLNFIAIIRLLEYSQAQSSTIGEALVLLLLRILKNLPMMSEEEAQGAEKRTEEGELYLPDIYVNLIISNLMNCVISSNCHIATKKIAIAALSGFLSEVRDYIGENGGVGESRGGENGSFTQRKQVLFRSRHHSKLAVEMGIIQSLISHLCDLSMSGDDSVVKQQILVLLVSIINSFNDDSILKDTILVSYANHTVDNNSVLGNQVKSFIERGYAQIMLLLSNRSDLAQWLLESPGGLDQILMLVSSNIEKYQQIAAEILCLASSIEATTSVFHGMIENGLFSQLLSSPSPTIQTAAATAMTKLSIRAKAFKDDSPEIPELLRISVGTIKRIAQQASTPVNISNDAKSTATFTESDLVVLERALEVLAALSMRTQIKEELINGSTTCVSVVPHLWDVCGENGPLASLGIGDRKQEAKKKEENNRNISSSGNSKSSSSSSSSNPSVLKPSADIYNHENRIDSHRRSTALFAIAHILSNLTVTNEELRVEMLRDKEITPEEHKKLQQMQQIRTKDENGNVIEEKQDDAFCDDDDNETMCRERVKKLASKGAVSFMAHVLSSTSKNISTKAVDICLKTFCQMVREESIRGQVVQQGVVGSCCKIANDKSSHSEVSMSSRLSAAHVIARTCITTNPNLLNAHTRLDTIRPLLMLLTNKDALQIQQFEALLSLTNILSVGIEEQNKFAANKGIYTVHSFMYSDNSIVRRAAVEVFCNIASHKDLIRLLNADAKKLRFWMVLMEDWDGDEESRDVRQQGNFDSYPCYFTARAAVGTLAMSVDDIEITKKMCTVDGDGDCSKAIQKLLSSEEPELILRALVMIQTMMGSHGYDDESLTFIARDMEAGVSKFNPEDTAKIKTVLKEWDEMKVVRVQAIQFLFEYADIMGLLQNLVSFVQSEGGAKKFEIIGGTSEVMSIVQEIVSGISEMMQAMGLVS